MKTLDEVIKAFEICIGNYCSNAEHDVCPYFGESDMGCMKEPEKDALHYLKLFQTDCERVRGQLEDLKQEYRPNDPLTWDELRTMEGKPVWVEHKLFKGWRLVGWQTNDHMMNLVGVYSEQLPLFADDCGKTWQAYRKERE